MAEIADMYQREVEYDRSPRSQIEPVDREPGVIGIDPRARRVPAIWTSARGAREEMSLVRSKSTKLQLDRGTLTRRRGSTGFASRARGGVIITACWRRCCSTGSAIPEWQKAQWNPREVIKPDCDPASRTEHYNRQRRGRLETRPGSVAGRQAAQLRRPYRTPPDTATWYFDAGERQLVYVVNSGNRLELDSDKGAKQVRFRARLLKDRLQISGTVVEGVSGVSLAPVNPYQWQ